MELQQSPQYPLLVISNIHTNVVQKTIESILPSPEHSKISVNLYVNTTNGVVFWKRIGLTNEFLTILSSYGIEYTYYVSKGITSPINKEDLVNINSMIKRLDDMEDINNNPINNDDYLTDTSYINDAHHFITSIMEGLK